jgi:putative membrane protein
MLERVQVHGWGQHLERGWEGFGLGQGWGQGLNPGWHQGWQNPWFAGAGGFIWDALSALFWLVLLVALAVFVARLVFGRNPRATGAPAALGHNPGRDPALEIARERFARGEIDEKTFEAIKRTLLS